MDVLRLLNLILAIIENEQKQFSDILKIRILTRVEIARCKNMKEAKERLEWYRGYVEQEKCWFYVYYPVNIIMLSQCACACHYVIKNLFTESENVLKPIVDSSFKIAKTLIVKHDKNHVYLKDIKNIIEEDNTMLFKSCMSVC